MNVDYKSGPASTAIEVGPDKEESNRRYSTCGVAGRQALLWVAEPPDAPAACMWRRRDGRAGP